MCWSELFQFTASLLYLNVTNAAGKLKSLRKKTKGILWDCHRIHLTASLCCYWPPIPVYKPQLLWNLQAQHPFQQLFHFQFNTKSLFLHLSKLLAFSELVCQYVVTVCFPLFVHTTFALLYQIFHFLPLENSFSPSEGEIHTHTHTLPSYQSQGCLKIVCFTLQSFLFCIPSPFGYCANFSMKLPQP